jgi:Domain of unknown function (DUF397)
MKRRRSGKNQGEFGAGGLSTAYWKKSSLSMGNGNCIEIANVTGRYLIRDSKDRLGPALQFTGDEWRAFLGGVHNGEFDNI